MTVTLETLNECLKCRNQIIDQYEHREYLYNTVHSPSLSGIRIQQYKSPVEKAMERLQKADDRISQLMTIHADLEVAILNWLYDDLHDNKTPEFRRIVICHYLNGMSWKDTALHVLQSGNEGTAKNHIYRYFNKQ